MVSELRGIAFALSILAIFIGVVMCAFDHRPGIATTIIAVFIIFFVLCGVVLRYRDGLNPISLILASILPPLTAITYTTVAVRRLHCVALTGGTVAPSLDFLGELLLEGTVLVWMGIAASSVIRVAARYWDSPALLEFLHRQTERAEALGKLVDKLSGLSKIGKWLHSLVGKENPDG